MRVSVCASLTYYYTVDVPDSICAIDEEGYTPEEGAVAKDIGDSLYLTFHILPNAPRPMGYKKINLSFFTIYTITFCAYI